MPHHTAGVGRHDCVVLDPIRSRWPGTARVLILAFLLVWAASCAPEPAPTAPSSANPATGSPSLPPPDLVVVASGMTLEGLSRQLDALETIARENGGTREAGGAGDRATAGFIVTTLATAGYAVTDDRFQTAVFLDPGGSSIEVPGAGGRTFEDGRDFRTMLYSAAATVEGPVVAIGWDPDARNADGPGCAAADYAGVPAGAIVLVRPGDCWRRSAVELAQAAGAAALVTAAPWSGRDEVRRNTLVEPGGIAIPSIAATGEVGDALADAARAGGRARITATGRTEQREVRSVIAELPGSDPDRVVIVGAHLDSTLDGPGLNDNGSGVAALLELARAVAGTLPRATIRFAFWAAEEPGLRGSSRYVERLSPEERGRLVAYVNVDMLGSRNGITGVYDEEGAAPGSADIRDLFIADLERAGLAWEAVDLGGGSDHFPFMMAGVPTGGLFSGGAEKLSPAQAERYGGASGSPQDSCFHLACDGRSNVDGEVLARHAASLARVVVQLASEP
jgi:Zn-dependent M28 family amino/carboxypeptidase